MLVLKNINKTYRSKKVTHQALKDVSLTIGSKGFVVILGKSGSGKSTLLNILGGLDSFDEGEILIKNKSSKDLKRNEWDSYRNTYVGFVFQEFYIIDEFTIGKNISLALELQGISSDQIEQRVEEILEQVDLKGYKERKPNEISGGQKQRIAIARALVKNPQIILADEPTGNLDSETGKLVLETLKKLSKEKLIIMVTHDEDFAYTYGDWIIEMKDGEVVRDHRVDEAIEEREEYIYQDVPPYTSIIKLNENRLTDEVIEHINDLLKGSDEALYLSVTNDEHYISSFLPFETKKEVYAKGIVEGSGEPFQLIPSSLPFANAFKLAVSSLLRKKFRLAMMIFLFFVSLIFVGVATNFTYYNIHRASALTFHEAGVDRFPIERTIRECEEYGEVRSCSSKRTQLTNDEIHDLRTKHSKIEFVTTYDETMFLKGLTDHYKEVVVHDRYSSESFYYRSSFRGISVINSNIDLDLRYGEQIEGSGEVIITDYMAEMILAYRLFPELVAMEELLGRELDYDGTSLIIKGILETDYQKYDHLKTVNDLKVFNEGSFRNDVLDYLQLYLFDETFDAWVFQSERRMQAGIDGQHIDVYPSNAYFNPYLLNNSRLPLTNDEVVLSVDALIELGFIEEGVKEEEREAKAIPMIGRTLQITPERYDETLVDGKTYTIVGIIDEESSIRLPRVLFHRSEIERVLASSSFAHFKRSVVLSEDVKANESFFRELKERDIDHNLYPYSSILHQIESLTTGGRNIFYTIGAVFALFASVMIFTFISSSIQAKKKEIGTLRAIGARGYDITKIFITEGLLIALVTSVLSIIGVGVAISLLNSSMRDLYEVDLVLLYMNGYSVLGILLVSLVVVTIATFIPLKRITLMKPINAIKK